MARHASMRPSRSPPPGVFDRARDPLYLGRASRPPETNVPELTIIICTLRRTAFLSDLLASLLSQSGAPPAYEVLVVDNDPAESARDLVECHAAAAPSRIRYLPEPRPGVSHARNAGVAAARGADILFLDDDQQVAPDFLSALWVAWQDRPIHLRGLRVRVEPRRDGHERRAPHARMVASALEDYAPVARGDFGTGGLVVQRALLDDFQGPFRPELGLLGGEDTELFLRASARGYHFGHLSSVAVEERVPRARAGLPYLLRAQLRSGLLDAELDFARAEGLARTQLAQRPSPEEARARAALQLGLRAHREGWSGRPPARPLGRTRAVARLLLARPRSSLRLARRAFWLARALTNPATPVAHRLQHAAYLAGRTIAAASERWLPGALGRRAVARSIELLTPGRRAAPEQR